MGSKIESKKMMAAAGVPVLDRLTPEAVTEAQLPVLVKASAGGGGRGMRVVTELDGLAPASSGLYDAPQVKKAFPGFANLVRESIETAGPRPVTPAYQDVSLAIQSALHPPTKIDPDDPEPVYDELKDKVEQGVNREGLL